MDPRRLLSVLALGLVATGVAAQGNVPNFQDLTTVRNRPWSMPSFFEVRAGLLGGIPDSEDKVRHAETMLAPDGHVFYHDSRAFGRESALNVYGGRDGLYAGLTEGDPKTAKGYTRVELFGRQWGNFIREGFYSSGDFIPVGLYEMRDWRARLALATRLSQTMIAEIGAYYGQNTFKSNDFTNPAYVLPDDHSAYGLQITFEDNTLQLDPQTYLPAQGYILAAWVQQEWNDSDGVFGITGRETELPSSLIRGGAHLEWYFPYTDVGTWVIRADGSLSPKDDRVRIYDASKPVGEAWIDGRVSYRLLLGSTFTLSPGARVQWVRIADEFATGRDNEFFLGGQVELRADFGPSFAVALEYSYLTNESREPVSIDEDSLGQHRLFLGVEIRL